MKKINGRIYYFGRWASQVDGKLQQYSGDDWWRPALDEYNRQAADLHAGRNPAISQPTQAGGYTVKDICNLFLKDKHDLLQSGEISSRTFGEYQDTCQRMADSIGKHISADQLRQEDFARFRAELAKQYGPVRLGNIIQRVRTVWKHAYDAEWIDKPIRFGPQFKKPSEAVLRKHKAKQGEKMLEPDQLRKLIDAAPVPLKAMVLLGVNCGFGNHDVATLPLTAINLNNGWINYPRPKTGIARRCPLWPETIQALREVLAERPNPKPDAETLVFVTARRRPWLNAAGIANPVSVSIRKLMKEIGVHSEGIGFYTLRHVFRTIADECKDHVACSLIMGHADTSIADDYRERVDDSRLVAVVEHVHQWLYKSDVEGDKHSR